GERLEPQFGRLGREYTRVAFAKGPLEQDPTLEWVTPGHPLFEVVRADVTDRSDEDLRRGAMFFDLKRSGPARLDTFVASVKDGRGRTLHRRLFVVETGLSGAMEIRQPTIFHEMVPADRPVQVPDGRALPDRSLVERCLLEEALNPFLEEVAGERAGEVER